LLDIAGQLGVTREQVIGVGDGANDLLFLAQCGVSVAYHAKPVVRTQTTYAINHAGLDGLLCLMDARAEAPFG
jgi:phosphoserine phosphatase